MLGDLLVKLGLRLLDGAPGVALPLLAVELLVGLDAAVGAVGTSAVVAEVRRQLRQTRPLRPPAPARRGRRTAAACPACRAGAADRARGRSAPDARVGSLRAGCLRVGAALVRLLALPQLLELGAQLRNAPRRIVVGRADQVVERDGGVGALRDAAEDGPHLTGDRVVSLLHRRLQNPEPGVVLVHAAQEVGELVTAPRSGR